VALAQELLAAIDIVGPAGECRVGHQLKDERRHVRRLDDSPDRQGRAQPFPAMLELIAEQTSPQRGVNEPSSDRVDPDRGELDGGVRRDDGQRGRRDGGEYLPAARATGIGAGKEGQRSARTDAGGAFPRDAQRSKQAPSRQ
jgi:hypothetical protein